LKKPAILGRQIVLLSAKRKPAAFERLTVKLDLSLGPGGGVKYRAPRFLNTLGVMCPSVKLQRR